MVSFGGGYMRSLDAVRLMLECSGLTSYRVAVRLGRHSSYISTMLRRGSVPSADLLARIAGVCGYDLKLISRDGLDSITIDAGPTD